MAYRSYGSYGSFSSTPDPGRSRRALEANKQKSQNFQESERMIQEQQRSYMQVMRQKLREEQQNRDKNFQLEQRFSRDYQDAVNRNEDQRRANTQQEGTNAESFWKSLGEFSVKAGEKYTKDWIKAENERNLEEFYTAKQELTNLRATDPEKYNLTVGLTVAEENQSMVDYATANASGNEVAETAGELQADPIRQMGSGYKPLIWQKAKSAHAASHLPNYFQENLDTTITVQDQDGEDVDMTVEQALGRGGMMAVQATEQLKMRVANLTGVDKLDPVWAQKNFFDPAERYTNRYLADNEAKVERQKEEQQEASENRVLTSEIYVGFTQNDSPDAAMSMERSINRIAVESGGKYLKPDGTIDKAFIRDSVYLPQVQDLIETGQFDNDLPAIKKWLNEQQFMFNGDQVGTLGDVKSSEALFELNQKISERETNIEKEVEDRDAAIVDQEIDAIVGAALENDGRIDSAEQSKVRRSLLKYRDINPALYQRAVERFEDYGPGDTDKINMDTAYAGLEQQANQGTLTELDIQQNMGWLSAEQRKDLTDKVELFGPTTDPLRAGFKRSDIVKDLRATFRQKLGVMDLGTGVDPSVNWAAEAGADYYIDRITDLSRDPNLTPEQVSTEARRDTMVFITKGMDDPNNRFYVQPADENEGTKGFVKQFKAGNYTREQRSDVSQQYQNITASPSLLKEKVYLSTGYLADLEGDIKNGRSVIYTPWVNDVARFTNKKPYEVLNEQLKAAGIKQEIKPGSYDVLSEQIVDNPVLQSLLKQPTRAGIATSIISSGNAVNKVRVGFQGEQDVMSLATAAGFKAPPLAAAMWALETGRGKTVHGPNALFNIKSKDGIGTRKTVKEFINGQVVQQPSTFKNYASPLESVKDLAEYTSKVPGFKEAKTYRQAIEAIYNAGYATDPNYVSKTLGVLKGMGFKPDQPIIEYQGSPATDPNYMSPTMKQVFYKTGDIMAPGMDPSQHTDVKQVDNPNTPADETNAYFDEDALENYVSVSDPEFGEVGLSELAEKYYGKGNRPANTSFYAARKYRNGVHLGWDYPTANGSLLKLKGGARVVGGYNTSFGYKAIIQLPDGRRFSFLHGSKA